jgi:hypothetical protein
VAQQHRPHEAERTGETGHVGRIVLERVGAARRPVRQSPPADVERVHGPVDSERLGDELPGDRRARDAGDEQDRRPAGAVAEVVQAQAVDLGEAARPAGLSPHRRLDVKVWHHWMTSDYASCLAPLGLARIGS